MGIGGKCLLPDVGEQVSDAMDMIESDAQGQRIDEETDQPFKRLMRSVSDRCTDNDIILTTESGKNETPGTQYCHKQSGVMALPKCLK